MISSKSCFKRFINRNLGKNSYYLINLYHEKSKLISRAYVLNVAPFKDHLFQKNIIDSGLCTCGKIETTAHYLLQCPNYIFITNETILSMYSL